MCGGCASIYSRLCRADHLGAKMEPVAHRRRTQSASPSAFAERPVLHENPVGVQTKIGCTGVAPASRNCGDDVRRNTDATNPASGKGKGSRAPIAECCAQETGAQSVCKKGSIFKSRR